MYKQIPIMKEKEIKENYASQVKKMLSDNIFWDISTTSFIPGLKVNPKDRRKIKNNGYNQVEGIYIAGIERREHHEDFRELQIRTWNIYGTEFYNSIKNMGYSENLMNKDVLFIFRKPMDTTENLIRELNILEELVLQ